MFTYKHFLYNAQSKIETMLHNVHSKKRWKEIIIEKEDVQWVKDQIKKNGAQNNKVPASVLPDERVLVERIKEKTTKQNRNNVTRTEAYKGVFLKHPELHWAFLAHMVSRNGGWCMTDLKGDLLPYLLNSKEREHLFEFFERINALIFQDAYPQLLLYEESKNQKKNLFHLLPVFHVSAFMRPFWNHFLEKQNSALLTVALIINEQHYIEDRVIQREYFQKYVLQTLKFKGQEAVQLTQVVFPYAISKFPWQSNKYRLAGLIIENFEKINERIEVGKKLYAILFGIEEVYAGACSFAKGHRHTGSRSDYWEYMFSSSEEYMHRSYGKERIIACKLIAGAPLFYSPALTEAWEDKPVEPPDIFEWFKDLSVFDYLQTYSVPTIFDMTSEYCFGINKMELAVLTKGAMKHQDRSN
ncbi:DUF2515 family protein [Alteribacillus sp. YIM 98480]|uniref:DUF2515 family protein n=1 Tax=Alteribacillus sp. YIM 98480 TaxID=2606599 RepID=UPI00131B6D1B|nr:DUF2515 family protein [Alteribacillus sp. YIM 98480]